MSNVARLALPLLALIVGFAAGTGFGVVVLGEPPTALEPASAPERAPSRSGAERETPTDPDDAEGAADAPRRRGVSVEDVAVGNALRGGEVLTAGDGAITGTILAEGGAPLEGVELSARPDFDPTHGDDSGGSDTLEARLRQVARQWRFEEGAKRTTTSGADGAYRIDRLLDGEYDIWPKLEGWTFRTLDGSSWEGSPGAVLDFVGVPVIEVTADVRLPDGTQPAGAQIEWRRLPSGESGWIGWSPESPAMDLAPGSYEFTATGGENDAFRVTGVAAEITDGEAALLSLALVERTGLRGTVTIASAELPTRVGLVAVSIADGAEADPARLLGSPWSAWVEEPFEYAIVDIPPGPYLVGVLLRNGRVLDHTIIEISSGMVLHDVAIGAVDVRDYVLVRLQAPGGAEVGDASIQVGYTGNGNEFMGEVASTQREDGAFVVPHTAPGGPQDEFFGWSSSSSSGAGAGAAGLTHFVVVSSPAFGQKRVEYDPSHDRELTIVFEQPAFALVAVSGMEGRSLAGRVQVQLMAASTSGDEVPFGGHGGMESTMVALDGTARVGPVAPGRYLAKLYVQSDENGNREVGSQAISLSAGETSLSMTVPQLHELRVRVEGNDLDLDLHPVADLGGDTFFMDEGVREGGNVTRFSLIAPGRYRVRAFGEGSVGEMVVSVPTSGTIVFRPRSYDAVRVEGVPSAWRGALEHSDMIVAVDGEELTSDHRIQAALVMARIREDVTFTVLRSGRQFDVTVSTASMDEASLIHVTR